MWILESNPQLKFSGKILKHLAWCAIYLTKYVFHYCMVQLITSQLYPLVSTKNKWSWSKSRQAQAIHIWANRTRSEKICIICHFFFGKAKLVRAGKLRYHNVVKWYLLKMDWGIEFEKKKVTKKIFSWIFLIDFFGNFSLYRKTPQL